MLGEAELITSNGERFDSAPALEERRRPEIPSVLMEEVEGVEVERCVATVRQGRL